MFDIDIYIGWSQCPSGYATENACYYMPDLQVGPNMLTIVTWCNSLNVNTDFFVIFCSLSFGARASFYTLIEIIPFQVNFKDALNLCGTGQLAVIKSETENNFVRKMLTTELSRTQDSVWIGGYKYLEGAQTLQVYKNYNTI